MVGYFLGISKNHPVESIPGSLLTDIIYAFVELSPEGKCASFDPDLDRANFAALRALREQNAGMRILFSIGGGGTSGRFPEAAASAESRQALARSCVQFLQANGLDGIDIDWEFPNRGNLKPEERENFTALLAEFRRQLDAQGEKDGRRYLLTAAAPAGKNEAMGFDLPRVEPLVDWINLMTYSYYDERSLATNLEAALFPVEGDPASAAHNLHAVVQEYRAAGIPAKKIMAGVVFYGRGWQGVPAQQNGLYQPPAGAFSDPNAPEGTWSIEGVASYRSIQALYLGGPGWERFWHEAAQAPWLYNAEQGVFITYEDAQSLAAKAEYVRKHQLGGIMIWQTGADDPENTLLKALAERLLR